MKLLCVGDIHIKTTNTHLVDLLENQIIDYVQNLNIDKVILLGDILHTFEKLHTQALNRAYKFIDSIRKYTQIYVLVGNHDYINNQQFLSDEHWMNGLKEWKNVYIIDKTLEDITTTGSLYYVPYVPTGRFEDALDSTSTDWKTKAKYIFAHQEFKGCKMGAITSTHGDEWKEDYPMVISGHVHDYQKPQTNIFYIGASLQDSFGDQTSPRLLLIDDMGFSELELKLPKNKTIYLDLESKDIEQVVGKILAQVEHVKEDEINKTKIVVKGDYEKFKIFTKSEQFDKLSEIKNCKIDHKPLKKNERGDNDSVSKLTGKNFIDHLTDKILLKRDEELYASFCEIVFGIETNPKDILIV